MSAPETTPKIRISEQFRKSAEALAANMTRVLLAQEARDAAALAVGRCEGALVAARTELEVLEQALVRVREITAPQSEFCLRLMEDEANENITRVRTVEADAS